MDDVKRRKYTTKIYFHIKNHIIAVMNITTNEERVSSWYGLRDLLGCSTFQYINRCYNDLGNKKLMIVRLDVEIL